MNRSKCIANKRDGNPCQNYQKYEKYCGVHKPKSLIKTEPKTAITITFGDCAENNIGMEILIGSKITAGFSTGELRKAYEKLIELKVVCELHVLGSYLPEDMREIGIDKKNDATLLIIRDGVNMYLQDINKTAEDMLKEHESLEWDKTILSRKHKNNGKDGVVNKNARWNLCYGNVYQKPDIVNGKGTIITFDDVPCTKYIKERLPELLGNLASDMVAEGNLYYDTTKCGIGFHGDAERNIVVAVRLGETIPLCYQWFYKRRPVGEKITFAINHGDIYVMSEKAVGKDWLKSSIFTLRHSAGCATYTTLKKYD